MAIHRSTQASPPAIRQTSREPQRHLLLRSMLLLVALLMPGRAISEELQLGVAGDYTFDSIKKVVGFPEYFEELEQLEEYGRKMSGA